LTITAVVPMRGFYDHLQVALSVLLAASASYAGFDLAGLVQHHNRIIFVNFFCMNCWRLAMTRATDRQEVVWQRP
jgi:hypothetical protein